MAKKAKKTKSSKAKKTTKPRKRSNPSKPAATKKRRNPSVKKSGDKRKKGRKGRRRNPDTGFLGALKTGALVVGGAVVGAIATAAAYPVLASVNPIARGIGVAAGGAALTGYSAQKFDTTLGKMGVGMGTFMGLYGAGDVAVAATSKSDARTQQRVNSVVPRLGAGGSVTQQLPASAPPTDTTRADSVKSLTVARKLGMRGVQLNPVLGSIRMPSVRAA